MKLLRSWKLLALLVAGTLLQVTVTCDPGQWNGVLRIYNDGGAYVDNYCCDGWWFNFDFFGRHHGDDD